MNPRNLTFLRKLVVNSIAFLAISGLTFISFLNYFNQSSLTPESEQLGFFNYLLPYFLTIGFIIYFTFQWITSKVKNKQRLNWIKLTLISIAAIIAIPWQIEHLYWNFSQEEISFLETVPYFIGMYVTMMTLIIAIKNKPKNRLKEQLFSFNQ